MRAARPDRGPVVSRARVRVVVVLLPTPRPQDLFPLTEPPHSCADVLLRKGMDPFLSRRSIEKSAACLPPASRRANLVLFHLEIVNAPPAKLLQPPRPAEFCRQARANRSIRPRD